MIQQKPVSEFILRDESSEKDKLEVESLEPLESTDEEDEDLIENGVLGIQALREQPMKFLSNTKNSNGPRLCGHHR